MISPMIDCIERVFRILLAIILALISYGLCMRGEQTNSIVFSIFVLLLILRINKSVIDDIVDCNSCPGCEKIETFEPCADDCKKCSLQKKCTFKERSNG